MNVQRRISVFRFIKKRDVWKAIDTGKLDEIDVRTQYELKVAQDLVVYSHISGSKNMRIAEIGGGKSRIIRQLAKQNECVNIDRFEGLGSGPQSEVIIRGVKNIKEYIGDFSHYIKDEFFDIIFSISVVEHVDMEKLDDFFEDSIRVLRIGGNFIHAIDIYVSETPTAYQQERYERYKKLVSGRSDIRCFENEEVPPFRFTSDMASNPDNIMYGWRKFAPKLHELRKEAQGVSLLIGGTKKSKTSSSNCK